VSIALSALVVPSRRLRAALVLFALVQLGAAALVLAQSARFAAAPFCASIFLLAALFLLHGCVSATKTHRIDVSGTGELRLTVQQEVGAEQVASNGIVVTLLPGTLVWSHLLLLHLGDNRGNNWVVPVLCDSLAPPEYRALRVALGTLFRCSAPAATTNEIL
jgi:hypothetical protein